MMETISVTVRVSCAPWKNDDDSIGWRSNETWETPGMPRSLHTSEVPCACGGELVGSVAGANRWLDPYLADAWSEAKDGYSYHNAATYDVPVSALPAELREIVAVLD